jgi:hypothetical protein
MAKSVRKHAGSVWVRVDKSLRKERPMAKKAKGKDKDKDKKKNKNKKKK